MSDPGKAWQDKKVFPDVGAAADLDIEAQTNAALRLGLLLGPFDHITPVQAVCGRCGGLKAQRALDDDP